MHLIYKSKKCVDLFAAAKEHTRRMDLSLWLESEETLGKAREKHQEELRAAKAAKAAKRPAAKALSVPAAKKKQRKSAGSRKPVEPSIRSPWNKIENPMANHQIPTGKG